MTRAEIGKRLPEDVKFSVRKVSFTDLARGNGYVVHVWRGGEELPSMFWGEDEARKWRDVVEALREIKGKEYRDGILI